MARDENTYGFNKADAEALVASIATGDAEYREGLVRGASGSQVKAFAAPAGGIAARSGATLGSATCTLLSVAGGTRSTTSTTYTVYNDFSTAVGANKEIMAAKIDGIWVVIAEDC